MSKVKIIDRRSEKSIKCEREFLSKLRHPFIVNMNCAFQDFENLYLVMDLLTGGDLRYHICRIRKFTEEETKFFISCLLLGLEYIHNNNIIHRDIKPENLVSDENGYIRITDFGVAKVNKEDNSAETSGTPGYMAPEVLMGQNHSFTVDFFAIGIMGYEFMFGTRPYNGKNRKEIKHMILKKQAKIDEDDTDWSSESVDFINKCLKRKDSRRLGYNYGIKELKNHQWFHGYDWDGLLNKNLLAPFVPKKEGNYDKKYCEMNEKCGDETVERYNNILNRNNFENLFYGYTYINLDLIQSTFNNETHTRFTTNSKQNKPTNSNNYSNKKEIIKNNNFMNNKNIKPHNKIIMNNFNNMNNMNIKFNSPILHVKNFFSGFKKVENKPVKPEINSPMDYAEKEKEKKINNEYKINDKIKHEKNKENISKNEIINNKDNNDKNNNSSEKNKKSSQKKLVNSASIRSLISTPPKGRKLKLDKNNSFLNLKGEINLFSNNNNAQNNNNNNETNLSSLLSSNSIVNFNYISKINSLNKQSNNKEKKYTKNPSNDQSTSNLNIQNNMSIYDKTQRNNRNNNCIIEEKHKKKINQLCYNFSCKDLMGSSSGRSKIMSGRNKSNLKIKFKGDNSYHLKSLSPRNKNDENSHVKKMKPNYNTKREFNQIIKNKNYIQLRQINMDHNNNKNILYYYLPNLNKINNNNNNNNNNKIFNQFNYENFKKKGKINLSNLYRFLKNKNKNANNKKEEKYYLINKDKNHNNSKIKRSGSTLLFNSGMNLEPKINNFINKNQDNREKENKNSIITTNKNNKNYTFRERKLRRNASDIF